MKPTKTAAVLALTLGLAGAQLNAPTAFAGAPDEREVWEMLKRSAMLRADNHVTKGDFIKLMEKRFDAMDRGRKGMLSPQEIARILDPNFANP